MRKGGGGGGWKKIEKITNGGAGVRGGEGWVYLALIVNVKYNPRSVMKNISSDSLLGFHIVILVFIVYQQTHWVDYLEKPSTIFARLENQDLS